MRIDFLCIGAQKGGTTTLNAYLRKHKQIQLPGKELHFFDNETLNWKKPDYATYHRKILQSNGDAIKPFGLRIKGCESALPRIYGEITPIYMYWKPCIERISSYNPEIKLIVLLRNPFARALSHWAMEKKRGLEYLSFSEAIRQESKRLKCCKHGQHRVYSYLDRGRYSIQSKRIFKFFPKAQILIIKSEDLYYSPKSCLHQISNFLQIQPYAEIDKIHARRGSYSQSYSNDDWCYMAEVLGEDISELEKILAWDCSDWRQSIIYRR